MVKRVVAAAVLLPIACSSYVGGRMQSPDPRPLAGCYALTIGPWAVTGGAMGLAPPERFRLDTAVVPDTMLPYVQFAVEPLGEPSRSSRHGNPPTWRPHGADSLSAVWFNGFAAGSLTLRLRGDSVTGRADTRSDVVTGNPHPSAPVLGRRIACPPDSQR
jgi:hypothetical protein